MPVQVCKLQKNKWSRIEQPKEEKKNVAFGGFAERRSK